MLWGLEKSSNLDQCAFAVTFNPTQFSPSSPSSSRQPADHEQMARVINSAILNLKASSQSTLVASEMECDFQKVVGDPAFVSLAEAVLQHSQRENISNLQAATDILGLIQKLDGFWTRFLLQEGLEKLRRQPH